jgi:CRISPR-associated protein Cas1
VAILYVTEQGASLTKQGDRLVITKQGKVIHWEHAFKVEQVALMGNISLTPSVIGFLLEQGIDTVFLTYYGRYRGRLISQFGKNIELRRQQFKRIDDFEFKLKQARSCVKGKINNCRVFLRRRNQEFNNPDITNVVHRLRRLATQVDSTDSIESLMGVEGASAASYFGSFGLLIKNSDVVFSGRNRRPPKDPVNVLLSLGYTLLANAIHTQVNIAGLDPYLGCLHSTEYGRPSLVLDLMEEFRPTLVDSTVIYAVNTNIIKHTDFYKTDEREPAAFDFAEKEPIREEYPILLKHEGMKKFISLFEDRLNRRSIYPERGLRLTYRNILLEQVRMFARTITGESEYKPFTIR